MGGKAFANHNPPLQTPRMPGSVYHEVKRRVEHRLSKAFSVVRFPIEGPAKQDFGDVDVFVTGPRFKSQGDEYTKREYLDRIGAVLGATAVIEDAGVQEPSAHFAIPWPRDLEHLSDSPNPQELTYAVAGPSSRPRTSAQIDTSPYPSFSAQVSTSTHPDASAPTVSSPYDSVPTPSNASPYATPSTPVTATTPTLPSFPAVPSAHSNPVIPTEFPLPRSRFDGTHAKPNQRPDWPRSTELEMTLPDREFRHVSGAQQRDNHDAPGLAPLAPTPEESVSVPFSRLSFAPDLPSSRPITPARERRLHIQVDVQVFDSSSRLHYMLFHHAHGDIWQLLGNVIKPYGLTVDDKGLWLRIPEIEDADRKRSKVWLTGDPDEILDFLGLPYTRYWAGPFRDLYQMYEYVANCVTFWVPSADETESALRANDRRRMKQRPAYRMWVEEFKPLCRAQGRFSEELMTRDQVRSRAFARFNVRQTYMTERRAFLVEDQKRHILKTIIERVVPLPAEGAAKEDFLHRTVLVRALKEIVLDWNRGLYSIMAPGNLRDDEGFYHLGRTESFVLEYKDRIDKEAMELHHRRMREKRAHEQPSRV
ncbi:hypothetical protein LRP88_01448 [Fusarium phalaenopsidis]